ncbi:hypothetical protein HQ576_15670, partial [bacterium]|nr:hypothetical protein [bacterium]
MSPRIHQQAASRPHAIDAHSQGILEYAKVKAMLAGYAASSLGRSAIGTLEPMTRFDLVSAAVAETSELRAVLQRKGRLPMAGMTDVRPVVAGEEGAAGIIEPHALRAVRNALLAACELKLLFEEEAFTSPHLARLGEQLGDFSHIADAVDAVVDNDGTVRDDASPALMVLRRRLQAAEARIRDRAHALARSAELRPFLQDSTVGVRQGHYVLAVRVECKHQVDGIVHDRSQSGASAYMEPRELVVMANELEDVRFQERREVSRLLRDLTLAVRAEREPIGHTLDTLAHVDLTYAKARFAIDYDMAAPEINDAGKLDVRRARHPILIRVLERDEDAPSEQKVVPIDYRLGEDFDLLVVTGPNTG